MLEKYCATWLAGAGLALVALMAHGQEPGKAAPTPAGAPGASQAETPATPQPLFIVQFSTGPGWEQDKPADEQAGFKEHSQNLSRLRRDGLLVLGARYQDRAADKGMLIIRADNTEAVKAQFGGDPMVKNKLFVLDIAEFMPFFDGYVGHPARTAAAPDSPLNALAWLSGCWFGRSGRNEFREHWMRPAGGLMMGMGRTTSGGKAVSYETMRIELDSAGVPVFVTKPSDQPEARFKSVKSDAGNANSIVFENPDHDFPQRVKYQLNADGTLDARIEGMLKGREARIDFPMRRASCE